MEKPKTAWLYCHADKWEGNEEISRQVLILCDFCKSRGLYIHGVSKRIGERKPPESFSGSDYLLVTDFNRISIDSAKLAEYIKYAENLGTKVVEVNATVEV